MSSIATEQVFRGIPVSPGYAIGRCFVVRPYGMHMVEPRHIPQNDLDSEVVRFRQAVQVSREQLGKIRDQVAKALDDKHADIFVAQAQFLNDPQLIEETERAIREEQLNADYLFNRRVNMLMEVISKLEDETFQAKNCDLLDVSNRIQKNLGVNFEVDYSTLRPNTVLVGMDLAPSETTLLAKHQIAGFVLEKGGATSHTAIMAKALEIPAVVGARGLLGESQHWDTIIIDGQTGTVILNPTPETLAQYEKKLTDYQTVAKDLQELRTLRAETSDGYEICVRSNVELLEEAEHIAKHGGRGIGLFRTEFLFMNRQMPPDEEQQLKIYRSVLEKVSPEPVVFRTLDFGGDKFLTGEMFSRELNPFMGLRAIRLCMSHPEIFNAQVRAMLRASAYGPVKILVPMISGLDEWLEVKKRIRRAKAELKFQKIPFDPKVQIGPMIEVPSAAVVADELALACDYFSIGTNDLIQYTLAVDRSNEKVAYLYEPFHPAVLRLLKHTVTAARKAGISISVCGEMASDPISAIILMGLGVDELSMSSISIPPVKRAIRSITLGDARQVAEDVLAESSIQGVYKVLRRHAKKFPELSLRRHTAAKFPGEA
jgi:phosphotransferase system enzyme I (PtsI)